MKHLLSLLLCAAMLVCCLSLCVYAEEETTAQAESVQQRTHIVFNTEMTGKKNLIQSPNHMAKGGGTISKSGEWQGIKIDVNNPEDPHFGLDLKKFFNKFGFEPLKADEHPFIVLKVLAEEITFDDFEIYYCAGSVASPVEDCKSASDYAYEAGNGELYFVFDLTDDAEGEYHQIRVDITGAEEGSLMYLTELVFFASEDEALSWCGYYDEPATEATEETTTAAPETEAETEDATEADTKKPAAKPEEKGCGGVIGIGAVVAIIALGAVCIKKKD